MLVKTWKLSNEDLDIYYIFSLLLYKFEIS